VAGRMDVMDMAAANRNDGLYRRRVWFDTFNDVQIQSVVSIFVSMLACWSYVRCGSMLLLKRHNWLVGHRILRNFLLIVL